MSDTGLAMDLTMDFQQLIDIGKRVGEAEKAKERSKAQKKATKRKGKKRKKFKDTPLTKRLIYKVMDKTDGTVYFVVGLGKTEELVEQLEAKGHELFQFTTNTKGNRLIRSKPWQCILSSDGKAGYRAFWRPGEKYTRCKIVRDKDAPELGLFTISKWPTVPGGIMFKLAKFPGGDDEITEKVGVPPFAGKFERMEREHLTVMRQGDVERYIIDAVTEERDLLDAVELVLNCSFSEKALKQAMQLLRRGTTQFGEISPNDLGRVNRWMRDCERIDELEELGEQQERRIRTLRWQIKALKVRWEGGEEASVWDLLGAE